MKAFLQEAIYQVLVVLRRLRYSRLFGGVHHRHQARADLRKFFLGLNAFLNELGVDYWLAYGTLLGYWRDRDLILGDSDLDFGLRVEDYQLLLNSRHRLPAGFVMVDTSHKHGGPKLYIRSGLFAADLYFYEAQGEELRLYLNSHYVADRTPVPRAFILPTRPDQFLGQPVRVPNQVEELLVWTYQYLGSDGKLDPSTGFWRAP
ncbi:LicD family protein [bacterium]|nr:LicD family protein [bacterium]